MIVSQVVDIFSKNLSSQHIILPVFMFVGIKYQFHFLVIFRAAAAGSCARAAGAGCQGNILGFTRILHLLPLSMHSVMTELSFRAKSIGLLN
jgi:hypothetical protein